MIASIVPNVNCMPRIFPRPIDSRSGFSDAKRAKHSLVPQIRLDNFLRSTQHFVIERIDAFKDFQDSLKQQQTSTVKLETSQEIMPAPWLAKEVGAIQKSPTHGHSHSANQGSPRDRNPDSPGPFACENHRDRAAEDRQ